MPASRASGTSNQALRCDLDLARQRRPIEIARTSHTVATGPCYMDFKRCVAAIGNSSRGRARTPDWVAFSCCAPLIEVVQRRSDAATMAHYFRRRSCLSIKTRQRPTAIASPTIRSHHGDDTCWAYRGIRDSWNRAPRMVDGTRRDRIDASAGALLRASCPVITLDSEADARQGASDCCSSTLNSRGANC